MDDPLVAAGGLWKVYDNGRTRTEPLRGVTMSCLAGETLAISGDDAGMSALLRVLALDEQPNRGWVEINGIDPWTLTRRRRERLRRSTLAVLDPSGVTQSRSTVFEQLTRRLKAASTLVAVERRRRAMYVLEYCGLTAASFTRGGDLTLEQQHRAALAFAIILEPRLILVDHSDRAAAVPGGVFDALFTLNREQGVALLVATTSGAIVSRCDRQIVLRDSTLGPERAPLHPQKHR